MGQLQLFEEARHALVEHRDAVTASGLRQSAAEPSLSNAAGAGDDQVALVSDPLAGEQALEQRLVEAAPGAGQSTSSGQAPRWRSLAACMRVS